jgi:hypothetical protein
MRSKLILALLLLIGLFFPMLPKQGGRAAAPSASGRSTCASRIPVRANARPEAEGTGLGFFLPQDTTAAARGNPTWEQLEYITSQTLDVALDEFYYSAGGHSGRHSEI